MNGWRSDELDWRDENDFVKDDEDEMGGVVPATADEESLLDFWIGGPLASSCRRESLISNFFPITELDELINGVVAERIRRRIYF